MNIQNIGKKIDKKALLTAISLMMLSWAALPFIYWLLVRRKKEEKEDGGKQDNRKPVG